MAADTDRVVNRIREIYGHWHGATPIATMREDWDRLFGGAACVGEFSDAELAGVPCRWIGRRQSSGAVTVVYVHGGGFRIGSLDSHHDLMVRISAAAGATVLGVGYRLTPEAPYPAQLEDVYRVYVELLQRGTAASRIAVAGDSAGANLIAATLNRLSKNQLPMPCAAVYLSPWFDMTLTADSYRRCAAHDPIHHRSMLRALVKGYLGDRIDPADPQVSPLFSDLSDMPATLIQVGAREVLVDDSIAYAEQASAAGVAITLQKWRGMFHVFQMFASELPQARRAIGQIGEFLRGRFF